MDVFSTLTVVAIVCYVVNVAAESFCINEYFQGRGRIALVAVQIPVTSMKNALSHVIQNMEIGFA